MGFKEVDLGSCGRPACRAELFGWRAASSAEGLLAEATSPPVQPQMNVATKRQRLSVLKKLNIHSAEGEEALDLAGLSPLR